MCTQKCNQKAFWLGAGQAFHWDKARAVVDAIEGMNSLRVR